MKGGPKSGDDTGFGTTPDLWSYRDVTDIANMDLSGFKVEAVDGSIGSIDEASNEVGASYLVVDTGRWIFGRKVMLPASVVDRVDSAEETVYVNRTKDEIKDAPEFDESRYREQETRARSEPDREQREAESDDDESLPTEPEA